jgi:hypothetical protein
VSYEFPFPTGQTTAQLYNWSATTAATLRRVMQDLTGGEDIDLTQLQSDVADLQTQTASLQSQINDIGESNFLPQDAFELSLVTRADGIIGSFPELRNRVQTQFEQNADATMRAAIEAAKANTGVRTTVRVMNEQNLALAERIDQVTADLGVTNADVTALTQTVADGDSSLATQITDVQSTVAGNTASIEQNISSINGIKTQYSVNINSQGEQIGWFRMDGSAQGTSAAFNVDYFSIGKIGTDGGNSIQPFTIGIANGVATTVLRGEVISDNSISTPQLKAGAVTADKISANTLSAITANLGTVTAGLIRNAANTLRFDLPNMRIYRADGKFDLNAANNTFVMKP